MQTKLLLAIGPASVAQLDARLTGDQEVTGLISANVRQLSSSEIDHEIFSTVILALPLIPDGQLSVYGECALVNTSLPLRTKTAQENRWFR